MRVKYAAGIVKNRVTADRRVTCAIEHVGSIPSFHRSAHRVTPPPPCFLFSHSSAYSSVLLPQNFPPTSRDHRDLLPCSTFFLFLFDYPRRRWARGRASKEHGREKRGGRRAEKPESEFANDFGTNHSRHAFFLGGLCLVRRGPSSLP